VIENGKLRLFRREEWKKKMKGELGEKFKEKEEE